MAQYILEAGGTMAFTFHVLFMLFNLFIIYQFYFNNKFFNELGLYTNGNTTAKDMATAENMNIWLDALAIADSKEEILQKIENDK